MVTLRRKLNLIQFTTEHRLTAGSRWRESCEWHLTFKARFASVNLVRGRVAAVGFPVMVK